MEVRGTDAVRETSLQSSNAGDNQPQGHGANTIDSPPDNFDPRTMSEADQCPICYCRVATRGFTCCKHRVCPHCLDRLLMSPPGGNARIPCPMCRQGGPKDTDMREVARRARTEQQEREHAPVLGTYNGSGTPPSLFSEPSSLRPSHLFSSQPNYRRGYDSPSGGNYHDDLLEDSNSVSFDEDNDPACLEDDCFYEDNDPVYFEDGDYFCEDNDPVNFEDSECFCEDNDPVCFQDTLCIYE